jgi:hypothetical protein
MAREELYDVALRSIRRVYKDNLATVEEAIDALCNLREEIDRCIVELEREAEAG